MQYGSAMHTALKAHFDGVRAGRPPGEEAVIACFVDQFEQAKIGDEYQRKLYLAKGREELTRLLRSELAGPAAEIVDTERRFKVQIGDAVVTGRMDRLDRMPNGEVTIIDYKTGKAKSQEDADKSLQLSVYALAARELGMQPGPLVLINLENSTAMVSRRSEEELRQAEKDVIEVADKIARGEFAAKLDFFMCRNCSYYSICPEQEVAMFTPARDMKAN
jgi:RecB family exonuclease